MKINRILFTLLCVSILFSCRRTDTKAPAPVLPVPDARQVEWQKMETYAFVHFGLNTFNGSEWGYGDKSAASFNPARLDCEQWARTFKEAGMKGVIITAKHHDGFCLWPSELTPYCLRNSPYKNGRGDILGELSTACRKYGLRFGVYLSPWDRNHAEYGSPAYIEYYQKQLLELMTRYGEIFEVWLDGANGGDGWYGGADENRKIDRRTYYDFPRIHQIVSAHQPQAVIFSDGGPGCRWAGNERGVAGFTNWSFLRKGEVYAGYPNKHELQSGHADGDQWVPAECDVSIRPGWFYHPEEDLRVKTVAELTDLYYRSVGRNANLLLNFPVDTDGLIHPVDSAHAVNWHKRIMNELKDNLLEDVRVIASETRGRGFRAENVTDRDWNSYWATSDGVTSASLTFPLPENTEMNRVLLQEYIPLGQRVASFRIEVAKNGEWTSVETGDTLSTIGYKRIVRFRRTAADSLRIRFDKARGPLCINNVEAFLAPQTP